MHSFILDMLQCPACRGSLDWQIEERQDERIEAAMARCTACEATYPVRQGIGIFLTPDLPRNDLWEQVDNQLARYLSEQPGLEQRLMHAPLEALEPADRFYRAMVLEERGALAQAKAIYDRAITELYTPEYLICYESQIHYLIDSLYGCDDPVVDLSSGRADLVQEMAGQLQCPILATDFSPRVLRRDQRWFQFFGLYDRISLLAFDARRTPFKDGAVKTMTTNLGLANIQHPGPLLKELRRIVSGRFLAISAFYPEGGANAAANAAAIEELGQSDLLFRSRVYKHFVAAGWNLQPANLCQGRALPTPTSQILGGAGIDSLPVVETMLEWATLQAD